MFYGYSWKTCCFLNRNRGGRRGDLRGGVVEELGEEKIREASVRM